MVLAGFLSWGRRRDLYGGDGDGGGESENGERGALAARVPPLVPFRPGPLGTKRY